MIEEAKRIARDNLTGKSSWQKFLERWWRKRYQQSTKSVEFGQYTWFELLIEFYEDFFEEHPIELLKARKDKDGNIQFKTGDALIDYWEEQIAKGQVPDLTEGMTEEERVKFASIGTRSNVSTLAKAQSIIDDHIAKQKVEKFRLDR